MLAILFNDFAVRATGIAWLGMLDQILVLGAFFAFVLWGLKEQKLDKVAAIWPLFVLALIVLSVPSPFFRGFIVSIVSAVLFAKIFVIFYLGCKLDIARFRKLLVVVSACHIAGFVLNLIFSGYFESLLPQVSFNIDTSRVIGLEVNANRFAALSAVLALYYYFIEKRLFLFGLMVASMFMAESRSLFAVFAAGFFYLSWIDGQFKHGVGSAILFIVIIIGIPFFVTSFTGLEDDIEQIETTVGGDSKYIRAAMLMGGWSLAVEHFPFGSGGGTFGSPLSLGSDVYNKLGMGDWATVEEGTGIHDSGVGSLLGEYGVVGAGVMLIALWRLFKIAGKGAIRQMDVFFLVLSVIGLSFFRGVVSSYFYSAVILLLFWITRQVRFKQMASVQP